MRYLVTGGLGYVGSWISRGLALAGHTVYVLSRGSDAPDIGAPYTLVQADIVDLSASELAERLPTGLDACVHAASHNESFEPEYAKQALLSNAFGTRNLLEAFQRQSQLSGKMHPLPLLLYCSTYHVAGATGGKLDGQSPAAPRNDYALTHYFAEEYCRMYARTAGQPSIIVRLSNGYGLPLVPSFGKWYLLINDLCRQAVMNKSLHLRSNPLLERDFIWLGDVARCFELLLPRRDLAGSLFLLAAERTRTIQELAETIALAAEKILGSPIPIHFSAPASRVKKLRLDAGAIKKALHWSSSDRMEQEINAIISALHNTPGKFFHD